ncbi:MAG: hypothetical protein WD673_01355 [Alphaproteobacteria bacterium]
MKNDPIRELLEDEALRALIAEIADHPDLDHVTIVTLRAVRKGRPARTRCKPTDAAA